MPFFELGAACCFYGKHVTKFFTLFNVVLLMVEIVSSISLLCILFYDWGGNEVCEDNTCFLYSHPLLFSAVIAVKWFYFVLALLCTRWLGENVLPAFLAVTSKEAIAYVTFLVLCFMMVFQAYFVLPIAENWEDALEHKKLPWVPVLKVYRLLFLGDFDLFELEGLAAEIQEGRVSGTSNSDGTFNVTGVVDDQDPKALVPQINGGMKLAFVIVSSTITVMFMNVGIGLLSSMYDEAKAMKHQIHQNFRADYTVKLLFWRIMLPRKWLHCLCGHDDDIAYDDDTLGMWIASDAQQLKDEEDETLDICQQLQKDMGELLNEPSALRAAMRNGAKA